MSFNLPPPPGANQFNSASWQDWFFKLRTALSNAFSTITTVGMPAAGASGYVLTKDSTADYDASWQPTSASLGPFTDNAVIVADSTTAITSLASLGTTTTLLHGNAAGVPTWGAVSLTTDVSGNLPVTNLNSGTGASASTYWRGDGTWATVSGGSAGSPTQTRIGLSGSTNGATFTVAATTLGGANTIHTSTTGTTNWDEITIWVNNTSTSAVAISIVIDGSTVADIMTQQWVVPANSPPILICDGYFLQNAKVVKAFAGTTNVINITGHVVRNTV